MHRRGLGGDPATLSHQIVELAAIVATRAKLLLVIGSAAARPSSRRLPAHTEVAYSGRFATYWARLQFELGEVPGLVGDVVSRSRDFERYLVMEGILAGDRPLAESDWGELFLDVADQAGSLAEGVPLVYSFDPDERIEFPLFTQYLSLVMGYFRGRRPGTSAGEEFFYVFTTHYYSGGAHLYPRDLSRAQAEKVLSPLGLELAGEPQFQECAMTTLNIGATVELAY